MAHWIKFLELFSGALTASGIYTIVQAIAKPIVLPAISATDPDRYKKINRHFMSDKRGLYKASAILISLGVAIFIFTFIIS